MNTSTAARPHQRRPRPPKPIERADLPIEGMTCASCANRIEKRLGKQPGVESASVNFATKVATVKYDPAATGPEKLAKAVDDIGYKAVVPPVRLGTVNPAHGHAGHDHAAMLAAQDNRGARGARDERWCGGEDHSAHMNVGEAETRRLLTKMIVGAVLSLPVLVIAMSHGKIEAFNVSWINWLQLALTTPVMFWCGWQFFRSAWKGLRHFSANMDTLVAMGTGAAYLYSLAATIWPGFFAGVGAAPRRTCRTPRGDGRHDDGAGLLRGRGGHHRADPAGQVLRGPGDGPDERRHQAAHRDAGQDRSRHARRHRAGCADRIRGRGRPRAGAPRREDPRGRER
jgi:copper chaperone CopZ